MLYYDYRLLGPHVNHIHGGVPEVCGEWRAALYVLLYPFPEMSWLRADQPRAEIVVRAFQDDAHNPSFDDPNLDPLAAALSVCEEALRRVGHYPATRIQLTNEPTVSSAAAMKRLAIFDAECCRLMASHGKKITIANLAVGNPSDMGWLEHYIPAIETGIRHGALMGLHAYNWPGMDPRWYVYRYKMFYEGCPEHGWGGLRMDQRIGLLLLEVGFDYGIVEPGVRRGWRNIPGLEARGYSGVLASFDQEFVRDPYVVGGAIFCYSNLSAMWVGYDTRPEPGGGISRSTRALYRVVKPQQPPKPPMENLVRWLPTNPDVPYPRRWKKTINQITTHHTGGKKALYPNSRQFIRAIANWKISQGEPGFPYHYAIGQDEVIYKTTRHGNVCWHAGDKKVNKKSIAIVFLGNHKLRPPSKGQVDLYNQLTDWLGYRVRCHWDIVDTECPVTEGLC
jgi:hypothetical protein